MKQRILVMLTIAQLIFLSKTFSQNVSINTTGTVADASSMLDIAATGKGLLIPRMTQVQRTGILSPADALLVYQTDGVKGFYFYNSTGSVWTLLIGNGSSTTWNTTGNSAITPVTNFLGTTDNNSLRFRTNNIQRFVLDSLGNVAVGSAPVFTAGNAREKFLVDAGATSANPTPAGAFNVISGKGYLNGYLQLNIQNNSPTANASSDIVASNDSATEFANFIDMGINSSGNTSTGVLGGASTAYLYGMGNDFSIGNGAPGKNLSFFTTGALGSAEKLRIDSGGKVGIGTTTPATKLHVQGTNPLTLIGVVAGTNTTNDSLLTITAGLVRALPLSTFASAGNWSTTGNAGTNPASNFLGTTDNRALSFRTNNSSRMHLDSTGGLFIGDSATAYGNNVNNTQAGLRSDWTTSILTGDTPRIASQGQIRINLISTSSSQTVRGLNGVAFVGVSNGVTSNTTDVNGGYFTAHRKTIGSVIDGSGTLNTMTGVGVDYGHPSGANAGAITTNVYGVRINPYYAAGTITNLYGLAVNPASATGGYVTNMYDIFLANHNLTNVTNAWGIYQQNTQNNYFAGNIGIGTTTPSTKLHVQGANPLTLIGVAIGTATTADSLLTITTGLVRKLPISTFAAAGSDWSTLGNAGTNSGSNFLGTTDSVSLRFRTKNIQTVLFDSLGNVAIGNNPLQTSGVNIEKLLVDAGSTAANSTNTINVISGKGYINNYMQLNIQNKSNGNNASSDVVATNDAGTEANGLNYIDMGVNSSSYSTANSSILNGVSNAYLYSTGNDMVIGNATSNKDVILFAGGITPSNEAMRINGPTGRIGINNVSPSEKLDVTGNIKFSGALMPGNNAGSIGTVLTSQGTNAAPTWSSLSATNIWSTIGNTGTNWATNFLGTIDSASLRFRTRNTQRLIIDSSGNVAIGSAPVFTAAPAREKFLVDAGATSTNPTPAGAFNVISGKGYLDGYLQLNIQNNSPTAAASSDIVASNDNASETANFIDMGINSSGNTSTGVLGGANTAYLYGMGSDFAIGNGTAGKNLTFFTGGTGANERMRIDGNGRVGIGTSSPADLLDISGTGGTVFSKFISTATTDRNLFVVTNSGTNGGQVDLRSYGSAFSETLFGMSMTGSSAVIANNPTAAPLIIGTSSTNSDVVLVASGSEKMRIDGPTGNIGIGTTAPSQKLDVTGSVNVQNTVYVDAGQSNTGSKANALIFGGSSSGEGIASKRNAGGNQYGLDFYTSSNLAMSVTSTGSAGIGTSAPAAKLDVAGTYKLGTIGTVLTNMIKTNVSLTDGNSFTYTSPKTVSLAVPGASLNASVIVNPRTALPAQVVIAYTRVSSAGFVEVVFNTSGTSTLGTIVFDITIIQ